MFWPCTKLEKGLARQSVDNRAAALQARKAQIKKFCYHTTCGLSCASVTVHLRKHPMPNVSVTGVCRLWLIFTLHFVTVSKGSKSYHQCEKVYVTFSKLPQVWEKREIFFEFLALWFYFKWVFKTKDKLIFKISRGSILQWCLFQNWRLIFCIFRYWSYWKLWFCSNSSSILSTVLLISLCLLLIVQLGLPYSLK